MSRRRASILALATLAAFGIGACGGESDGTFDHEGFPFTFTYPEDFEEIDEVEISQQLGAAAEETVAVGVDEQDAIILEHFIVQIEVNEQNLRLAKREIDSLLQQLGPGAPPTTETEVAGLPALTATEVPVSDIEGGLSDLTILFDGDDEYVINCQSTEEHRDEVDEACEMALDTLEFE